jgi:5-bromo-4-chloroindolyl phosphate hydrolysis protein
MDDLYDNTEAEEITFAELLATVMLNDEVIITIPATEVDRVKTGIKNVKAKQASKMKEDGLIPDPSTLSFNIIKEDTEEGDVDLQIILSRKSTIKIKRINIPSGEF